MNFLKALFVVAVSFVAVSAVFGIVTAIAWNVSLAPIFGFPKIGILEGFALNVLAALLIKPSPFGGYNPNKK